MLLAVSILITTIIQLIADQTVEWLAKFMACALDKCHTFPSGLITSEGINTYGLDNRRFQGVRAAYA